MKILVIGIFDLETDESHIAQTLEAMGHEVMRWEPRRTGGHRKRYGRALDAAIGLLGQAASRTQTFRARKQRQLLDAAHGVDLTIVCHDFLAPPEVAELRRQSASPVVLWFLDHIGVFGAGMFMAAPYDHLFFKDPYIVRLLSTQYGLDPVHYLPECCNVHAIGQPREREEMRCDIAVDGNQHAYRVAVFSHLTDHDVRIWGDTPPAWMGHPEVAKMAQHRFVSGEDKSAALRSAAIVVNTLHPAEIESVNRRTFEAAASEAFQLIQHRPGLEHLFEDGKELVSFSSIADLKQKVDHFLAHPEKRRVIAGAGRRRALAEHTYEHRLDRMIDTVRGNRQGHPLP